MLLASGVLLGTAIPAAAQSLFLQPGQHGVEAAAGWSFGPSSDGLETRFGVGLNGRVDLGAGFNRYTLDFDDGSSTTFTEAAPYVRWFAVKEGADAPVSLALAAQYFISNLEGDDTGAYVMTGPTLYKRLRLADRVDVHPFLGFSFVGESYTFGGVTDRAAYLARHLGVIFTSSLDRDGRSRLRVEIDEQSFRRETYRAARIGFVRMF